MTITTSGAAGAYAAMQRLARPDTIGNAAAAAQGGAQASAVGPGSFGQLVQDAVNGTLDSGRSAEMKALDMAEGKASIVDVVTAVAETEVAVETLVTVRDKMISAYKDILNMPI
jgi:flagellar hook-basal body complex protein FliE